MKALRILVVEDNATIGSLIAELLEDMGHDVCAIVATEDDAVAAAARCKPNLLIVDAWLDDGSGLSAVERICRTGFVSHLFLTGDILGVKALRPDAVVVEKPFGKADLAQGIQRALTAADKS